MHMLSGTVFPALTICLLSTIAMEIKGLCLAWVCVSRPGGAPPPRRQSRGYGAPQGGYEERPAPEMRPGGQRKHG